MKNLSLFIFSVSVFIGCATEQLQPVEMSPSYTSISKAVQAEEFYYWAYGKKQYLTRVPNKYYAVFDESICDKIQLLNISAKPLQLKPSIETMSDVDARCGRYYSVVDSNTIEAYENAVIYSAPYFVHNQQEVGLTNIFYVKLKNSSDKKVLEKFTKDNNVAIISEEHLPLWYALSCTKYSSGNALELAVLAYESGLFAASDVELYGDAQVDDLIYNDPLFVSQWNLTDTYGIQIEDTHAISMGNSSIVVAVVDNGIQLDHPDLPINNSWDATSQTSPAKLYMDPETETIEYHGTAMASIIGAIPDNNVDIVGIAPNVSLLPISVDFSNASSVGLARAVRFAADNGARVISNSWSSGGAHQARDEAFEYALNKGCVVVQSSGNQTTTVPRYPYCLYPDVIVVGNMNRSGYRSSSSNYSSYLDIVAPGTSIPMLNASSSSLTASGTSPACAHISAIAGLMLSVNPDLTRQEVADIIEKTARKLPTYTFSTTSGRPNGTWNNEVGYGLVDCLAAVSTVYYDRSSLVEFDYSASRLEMSMTLKNDVVIFWGENDMSYINADADNPVDTTIIHTYGTYGSRHVMIAGAISPDGPDMSLGSAMVEFDLVSGTTASNIEISSANTSLEYIKITGGASFAQQTVAISNLPVLKELYLVKLANASVSVSNCPTLHTFATSKYIWRHSSGGFTPVLPFGSASVDPNVVGRPPAWPDIPESVVSPQSLTITGCPSVSTLSLENVGILSFNFSSLSNLNYVYLSSQPNKIVGAGSNSMNPSTYGYFLANSMATLPEGNLSQPQCKVVVRAVNLNNTDYVPVSIASSYLSSIETACESKGWNIVWDSGIN